MKFQDVIKKTVLEGFADQDISTVMILVTLGVTFLIGFYIFFLYRFITRRSFYDRDFNVSMAIISVVTAGIILAMQSNIVISLGMVGALSIVRFRTAIKNPMDLLFLFWSIGTGIVCGAGLYKLAAIIAVAVTIGILVLWMLPVSASPMLLIVQAEGADMEGRIIEEIQKVSKNYRIDSKSLRAGRMDLIIELRTDKGSALVNRISAIDGVASVNLLHHDGEVKA